MHTPTSSPNDAAIVNNISQLGWLSPLLIRCHVAWLIPAALAAWVTLSPLAIRLYSISSISCALSTLTTSAQKNAQGITPLGAYICTSATR